MPRSGLRLPADLPPALAETAHWLAQAADLPTATLLDAVLEHAPLVVFTLDAHGRVLRSIGQATKTLRERRGPIEGRLVSEAYADHPEVLRLVERALRGEAFVAEVTAAGRTFQCAYLPILDAEGAVNQVLGIAHDVTERSEAEARLNTLHRQLAEARLALHEERTRTEPPEQTRVLVVGGSSIHRAGLAALLSEADDLEAEAVASVHAALQVLASEPIAVCVLDVQADLDRLRRVREAWPDGAVVALVTSPAAARDAIKHAAGVVLRTDPSEEVERAVRSVLDGEPFLSEALIHAMAKALHAGPLRTRDALSEREREVLALYGAGLKRHEIAERLNLSRETIGTYRKRLLKKLGLASSGDLMHYAITHGLAADRPTERP